MTAHFVFSTLEALQRQGGSLLAALLDFDVDVTPEKLAETAQFLEKCAAYLSEMQQEESARLLMENAWLFRMFLAGEATEKDLDRETERIYFEAQILALDTTAPCN
jgi:xylose isomerase